MKILGILGSPRIGGNSDVLLDNVLKGASDNGLSVCKLVLDPLNISPCKECEEIHENGKCNINDDMSIIYEKVEASDIVVVASPIFFGSITAQTKIMIDRYQCLWYAVNVKGAIERPGPKQGYFICVSAQDRPKYFRNASDIVKNFFATINAECKGELFCSGVDKKGDVFNRQDVIDKAYDIGRNI